MMSAKFGIGGDRSRKILTGRLARMGMMTAVAVMLNFIPGLPIIPLVSFIHYEYSDIPILISVFAFGTLPGVGVAAVSVLLSWILSMEAGGWYGAAMHFIAIAGYSLTAGLVYQSKKTLRRALAGMIGGIVVMTAVMVPANMLITPFYLRMYFMRETPVNELRAYVNSLLLPGIIPVNAIKGAITAALTFIIYKRVSGFLHK